MSPLEDQLGPEAARQIAGLRAPASVQSRIDQLADIANDGNLTPEQEEEYDQALEAYHLITVLQARARAALRRHEGE